MKPLVLSLVLLGVPLALGCGCVDGGSSCSTPIVEETPAPETAPEAPVVQAEDTPDAGTDELASTAVALEPR